MRQEIIRKAIHLSINSFIPLVYLFFNVPKFWMVTLLGIGSVTIVIIDLGRTRNGWMSKIFGKLFNRMLRSHELEGELTGASYVLIGAFISVVIFPKEIAVLALLFTAFGDTAAALYGRKFGIYGKNEAIIKHAIRPTIEPSNVLFQILNFPNFLPYRAAAVSPNAVNNNARTAISFGNIATEINAPIRT